MRTGVVEKIGAIGALVTASACPACFPMLAVVGTTLGLGVLRPFEGWVFIVFQILVVIAILGNILSFVRHRRTFPLIIGLSGPLLIFFALYVRFNQLLLYLGLFGLAAASILNFIANRQCARC
jgi:MerC mercury resistance protein